jgi:hypothetical protein
VPDAGWPAPGSRPSRSSTPRAAGCPVPGAAASQGTLVLGRFVEPGKLLAASPYKTPKQWYYADEFCADEFPANAMGTLQKFRVKDAIMAGELTTPAR